MKLIAFSVYDSAAEAWLPPFFMRNKGEAIRSFASAANTNDHQFAKHADDYTLFEIGTFDDETGALATVGQVRSLGTALEYLEKYAAKGSAQLDVEDMIARVK